MGSVSPRAGSRRCSSTSSRHGVACGSIGSSMATGTAKRAGANWLPATVAVSALRTLIGMVMRSSSTSTPMRRW